MGDSNHWVIVESTQEFYRFKTERTSAFSYQLHQLFSSKRNILVVFFLKLLNVRENKDLPWIVKSIRVISMITLPYRCSLSDTTLDTMVLHSSLLVAISAHLFMFIPAYIGRRFPAIRISSFLDRVCHLPCLL